MTTAPVAGAAAPIAALRTQVAASLEYVERELQIAVVRHWDE